MCGSICQAILLRAVGQIGFLRKYYIKTIGYARVSTPHQDLELQHSELKAEGNKIARLEKVTGARPDGCEEIETAIEFLRTGRSVH